MFVVQVKDEPKKNLRWDAFCQVVVTVVVTVVSKLQHGLLHT